MISITQQQQCCKAKIVTTSTRLTNRINMSSATVFGKAVPAENGAHIDRVLILDAGAQYGKVNFINAPTAIKASILKTTF